MPLLLLPTTSEEKNYVAQSDVEQYLGITFTVKQAAVFNLLIQSMQDTVDLYCNRTWSFVNPVTEYFDVTINSLPPVIQDAFFTAYPISTTPADPVYPLAGGIKSAIVGKVNGQGGTPLDLTYVYSYKTHFKFWNWFILTTMYNPLGFRAVEVTYNSDDAQNVPKPIKQALIMWISRLINTSQDAGKEVERTAVDGVDVRYIPEKGTEMPDFVKFVLDHYRVYPADHF